MGRGPFAILAELEERSDLSPAEIERVVVSSPFPTEIATAFELNGRLSTRVRAAIWKGRLPVVLSGNCMSSIGTVAGIRRGRVGVIWLDAHADFHTPETSASGFADGMALATLTGRCWRSVAAESTGLRAVDPHDVLLVGARDLDPAEPPALAEAGVDWIPPEEHEGRLLPAIRRLAARVDHVYLHIDLDVLDPAVGRANAYAAEGGLTLEQTMEILSLARTHLRIAAAAFTAYDPAHDPGRGISRAAVELLRLLG